jgi:hypothetical protein
VLSNSLGTTAKIDFSAGTKDVFVTYPSDKALLGTTSAVSSTGTGSVVLSASPTLTGAVNIATGNSDQNVNIATNATSGNGMVEIGTGRTSYVSINAGSDINSSFTNLYGYVGLQASTQDIDIGISQTTGVLTIGGSVDATGTLTIGRSQSTQIVNIHTGSGSGNLTVGSASSTGTFTFGRGALTQTVNVHTGNVIAGETKTLNLGTSGQAGSTTNIAIGGINGTSTTTLNGKTSGRIVPRVSTTASSATPTINTDNTDQFGLTAQAVDITSFTTNLSGTPTDGQKLWIYIVGTAARAIAWGASFESSTATLPTTTVTTNRLDVGFVWNAATSKWRCVAVA